MTHGDYSRQIQAITLRKCSGEIEARSSVGERCGPSSAGFTDSPVLDRPGRNPVLLQGRAQIAGIAEVVFRLPPSSTKEDHQRHERTAVPLRDPKISELIRSCTVVDAVIRGQHR